MPKYLYDQIGVVAEIYPTKKVIVTFDEGELKQRALLWADKFICDDGRKFVEREPDGSIDTELALGDEVVFDCHIYDNDNNTDKCGWYVLRAQLAADVGSSGEHCANVMATIVELTATRGFAEFRTPGLHDCQRAVFVASRVFVHGQPLPAGSSLYNHLQEDQKVYLDARFGYGKLENAEWYATMVCMGQRPSGVPSDHDPPDEVMADEGEGGAPPLQSLSAALFPAMGSAENRGRRLPPQMQIRRPGLVPAFRHPYNLRQEKWGYVATILSAEYGVLLWQCEPRRYESVLFHRSVAHLFDLNLKKYDLRTIFRKGDHLRFEAEKSEHQETYSWKAYSVWVDDS